MLKVRVLASAIALSGLVITSPGFSQGTRQSVYIGKGYRTFVDLSSIKVQNSTRRANIERRFSDGSREAAAVVTVCPSVTVEILKSKTYSKGGSMVRSASRDGLKMDEIEKGFIATYLCTRDSY